MGKNRRLLAVLLALALALSLLPTAAFAVHRDDECTGEIVEIAVASATCYKDGVIKPYYQCTGTCGKTYSDLEGKNEINLANETVAAEYISKATGEHVAPKTGWTSKDAERHEANCATEGCEAKVEANHDFDKDSETPGGKCVVCEYECQHPNTADNAVCAKCGVMKKAENPDPTKTITHIVEVNIDFGRTTANSANKDVTAKSTVTITPVGENKAVTVAQAVQKFEFLLLNGGEEPVETKTGTSDEVGVYSASFELTESGSYAAEAIAYLNTIEGVVFGTKDEGNTFISDIAKNVTVNDYVFTAPNPETPTITEVKYDGSKVTWIYSIDESPEFELEVRDPENGDILAGPIAMTTATHEGSNWSFNYTLPSDIKKLSSYKISVADGMISGACIYEVKPSSAVDGALDKIPEDGTLNSEKATEIATDLKEAFTAVKGNDEEKKAAFNTNVLNKLDDIKKVEEAASSAPVEQSTASDAPRGMTMSEVVGLKLSATGSASITVGAADKTDRNVPADTKSSVFFSVKVSGSVNKNLSFPVAVTVGIPTNMQGLKHLAVVHYINGSAYETLKSEVKGTQITFVTWSFSDFAIVSTQEGGGTNGGSTGGSTGGAPNKGSSSTGGGKVTVTTPSTTPAVTPAAPASGFSDVPDTHTFASEIKWAKEQGYMNGIGEGAFSPVGTVNRQQIWMVLARMAGASPASMAEALAWAVENGISDGSNPTGPVSRQQLVTMMFRFAQKQENAPGEAGVDISTFADASQVSGYAQEALAWSVANNIVGGTADGRLNPYGNATRGAFAAILYRYYN